MNRVRKLSDLGQQIWLDALSRRMIASGELARLINEDGIAGVTSNPAIFQQALSKDSAYRDALAALPASLTDPERRFEAVALPDIQAACDAFAPLHAKSGGAAGYVSFEVSPLLAHDAPGTVAAARRLWQAIARPNVMIKIPATAEGLEAIRQCLGDGINVNVTLMFSHAHVRKVFDACVAGLEARASAGALLSGVRCVASVFISRWDSRLDPILEQQAPELAGQIAVASARLAYQYWKERFGPGGEFESLRQKGAAAPLLLWASTGTKNPAFRDVRYIEELVGPHTVNTVPEATLNAFRDHGEAGMRLEENLQTARAQLARLGELGIDLEAHGEVLQQEGLALFEKAFAGLLETVKA